MKTTEELLIARYKVIAPWFDMLERFEVGSIFEHPYGSQYFTQTGKADPADYPHLFKPLHWAEERPLEDMPMYVKRVTEYKYLRNGTRPAKDEICKIIHWIKWDNPEPTQGSYYAIIFGHESFNIDVQHFVPATEQDYLNFINPPL